MTDPQIVTKPSPKQERRLDRLAWLLDESIPLPGGFRVGLDSLIGVIPGVGDGIGAMTSTYILLEAYRAGASAPVLGRMLVNILIEALVGVVPIFGDLFDMVWKANRRNVDLLQQHLASREQVRRVSTVYLAIAILTLVAVFVALGYLAVWVLRTVIGWF